MRFVIISMFLSMLFFSCAVDGSGEYDEKKLYLSDFTKIKIYSGSLDVEVTQKDIQKVWLSGDDNLLKRVVAEVDDGFLRIDTDHELTPDLPLILHAEVPEITYVNIRGSSDVTLDSIDTKELTLFLFGTGRIDASGEVRSLEIDLPGSGTIDTRDLEADFVEIDMSGSGNVTVCADDEIDIDFDGSGSIKYYCDPYDVSKDVDGSGDVESMEGK